MRERGREGEKNITPLINKVVGCIPSNYYQYAVVQSQTHCSGHIRTLLFQLKKHSMRYGQAIECCHSYTVPYHLPIVVK